RNPASGHDWALEASEGFNRMILEGSFDTLIQYRNLPKAYQLAVPTPDHYLPLLYTLGLKGDKEQVKLFNDKTVMGSISMTSVRIG
ncbi:MAG TPA: 4,5-DOPA dioxygenase extradiol, partial [Bacteroidales bacterium]|nr:4,5-DOPA dioxygenase extradiol [Bacteroidales bacterium]